MKLTPPMMRMVDLIAREDFQHYELPGKHKVWRTGGKIYLEVFHND